MTAQAFRPHREPITMVARRENADSLLRGIDALTRKMAALGPLPLDVIDRYERILMAAHVTNLQRVADISDALLSEDEQ